MPEPNLTQHVREDSISFFKMLWYSPLVLLSFLFKKIRFLFIEAIKGVFLRGSEDHIMRNEFNEHKEGDRRVLDSILHGLDQNAKIVQDAAIQVSDSAKEMREESRLIRLSQEEHRREFEDKIKELHDKINQSNLKVEGLSASNKTVIDIAMKAIGKK